MIKSKQVYSVLDIYLPGGAHAFRNNVHADGFVDPTGNVC
jgi:hypothetical protein